MLQVHIYISLSCRVGSYMNNQTLRHVTFYSKSYRYICLLHDCECLHSRVRNRLGARDKGKNPRGDTMVVPLSSSIIKIQNGSSSFVALDSKNMVIHLQWFFKFFVALDGELNIDSHNWCFWLFFRSSNHSMKATHSFCS